MRLVVRALTVVAAAATALLVSTSGAQATAHENDPVFDNPPAGTATIGVMVTKLTHSQATSRLRSSNITWSSSGGCSDRNK
jgi:hypothetical protein